jgi:hypothetical protein
MKKFLFDRAFPSNGAAILWDVSWRGFFPFDVLPRNIQIDSMTQNTMSRNDNKEGYEVGGTKMKKTSPISGKKVSHLCKLSRMRELSVLLVIGVFLGTGLLPITNAQAPTIPSQSSDKITNSKGYSWPASGQYIQTAIDNLSGPGEVWIPAGNFTLSTMTIKNNGVSIHGYGPDRTILTFTGSNYGIMAAEKPGISNSNFRWGLQNIQLDGFTFKGSAMWLVIRKGLVLQNINAKDVQRGYAAIRLICPYGNDNNGDGWADSTGHYWSGSVDSMIEDVQVINCHTMRTSSMGFALWSTDLKGVVYKNIVFDGCSATQGGYGSTSTGTWSVGFNFGEIWNVAHVVDEARVQDLTVRNCGAYENWESGFHFENKLRKTNIYFNDCTSNNNGQKYLKTTDDAGEAWKNPYGAGYFTSYKNNPNDNNMVFTNCVANGNGAWGWRVTSTRPTFVSCSGDAYPNDLQGNGRWTLPKMTTVTTVGGLCKVSCSGLTDISLTYSGTNRPPSQPVVSGPATLGINRIGTYSTSAIDPDGDLVQYRFYLDDIPVSNWTTFGPSGHLVFLNYSWSEPGIYHIKVQARDQNGIISAWSNGLAVMVTSEGELLDQQQTQHGINFAMYSTRWSGQSFKPTLCLLTGAEIYMRKIGSPSSSVTLSVRKTISGSDLVSISKPASEISTSYGWVKFDFSDLTITPGSTYYLVLRTSSGSSSNCYSWGYGYHTPYTNGIRVYSTTGGSSWINNPSYDNCFKIYGM